mmetsp:Transcript_11750/g.30152  ORF Transcript_11750/g.30152 Transcript_11750/m.30152 type:complete len:201 (-) Transcript_11750:87-689(-)
MWPLISSGRLAPPRWCSCRRPQSRHLLVRASSVHGCTSYLSTHPSRWTASLPGLAVTTASASASCSAQMRSCGNPGCVTLHGVRIGMGRWQSSPGRCWTWSQQHGSRWRQVGGWLKARRSATTDNAATVPQKALLVRYTDLARGANGALSFPTTHEPRPQPGGGAQTAAHGSRVSAVQTAVTASVLCGRAVRSSRGAPGH